MDREIRFAYQLLRFGFSILLFVTGIDKFFNYLTWWPHYLNPYFFDALNDHFEAFMRFTGVLEMVIAFGLLIKPKIFSYFTVFWMASTTINLFFMKGHHTHYDVILRDIGLFCGSLALLSLTSAVDSIRGKT